MKLIKFLIIFNVDNHFYLEFSNKLERIPNHALGLGSQTVSHVPSVSTVRGCVLIVTIVSHHGRISVAQLLSKFFGQPQRKSFLRNFLSGVLAKTSRRFYAGGASFTFRFDAPWFPADVVRAAGLWKRESRRIDALLRVFAIIKFKGLF